MLTDRAQLKPDERTEIEALIASQPTIEEVVHWGFAERPRRFISDIVVQDEVTHDVTIPWRGDIVLAYQTTCFGAVTGVVAWRGQPSARELLDCRVAQGWRPLKTRTQSGERVLGYAACLGSAGAAA